MTHNKFRWKILVLIWLCVNLSFHATAQISSGGMPYSYTITSPRSTQYIEFENVENNSFVVTDLDMDAIRDEIEALNTCVNCSSGFYYGKEQDVQIDFFEAAQIIETTGNKNVWILKIESAMAEGFQLICSNFYIAEGGKLFIYNEDRSMLLGAFTSENNRADNIFVTQHISGSNIYIEYVAPTGAESSVIFIDKLVYIFDNFFSESKGPFSDEGAAECQTNTSCLAVDTYDIEVKSTVLILGPSGADYWGICTGVLINDGFNYASRTKPFLLTANHCYEHINEYDFSTYSDVSKWVFLFRHEATSCTSDGSDLPSSRKNSANGGGVLSRDEKSQKSDYLLIELNNSVNQISRNNDVVFAGYDVNPPDNIPGGSYNRASFIHHPKGDVKKITLLEEEAQSVGWNKPGNDHWEMKATAGFKGEPGSSGAPLFNKDHQVIGLCHGGNDEITCDSPKNEYATVFGKLSVAYAEDDLFGYLLSDYSSSYTHTPPPASESLVISCEQKTKSLANEPGGVLQVKITGDYYQDDEEIVIYLTVNKTANDREVSYSSPHILPSNIYYVDNSVVKLALNPNFPDFIKPVYEDFELPPFSEEGVYRGLISIARESSDYERVVFFEFDLIVSPKGYCACEGNFRLTVAEEKVRYSPESEIGFTESLDLKNELTYDSLVFSSHPDCFFVYNNYFHPRYVGVFRRTLTINDVDVSIEEFETAKEYVSTNPGSYYEPKYYNIAHLLTPGVNKVEVMLDLADGYDAGKYIFRLPPQPNKTFRAPFYLSAIERGKHAYSQNFRIIVANCDGSKVVDKANDPLLSTIPSDEKIAGMGTIEIKDIELEDNRYEVEAFKKIVLKPGTKIKSGTYFKASIVPCEEISNPHSRSLEIEDPLLMEEPVSYEAETDKYLSDEAQLLDDSSSIVIYPNPTTGLITVASYSFMQIEKVQVIGSGGVLLMEVPINDASGAVDVSHLTPGTYILKIFSEGKFITQTIIKQ